MNEAERFNPGDIIRHFKREFEHDGVRFLYVYAGTARHTETGELLAVYKALYGDGTLYARPLKMFNEVLDNGKLRFEKATMEDLMAVQYGFSSETHERH